MDTGAAWRYFKHAVRQYGRDNSGQLAAAISYYVLFSIVPLTFVLVSIFGLFIRSERLRTEVVQEVVESLGIEKGPARLVLDEDRLSRAEVLQLTAAIARLTQDEREAIAEQLERSGRTQIAGVLVNDKQVLVQFQNNVSDTLNEVADASAPFTGVSLFFSAWSGSAMFGAVRKALNVVWKVDVQRAYLQQKVLDLLMVMAFGGLILVSVAATGGLRVLRELSDDALGPLSSGSGFFWGTAPFVLPGLISFAVFALLYKFVPAIHVRFRDVWFGALVAALLFEVLKNGFAFYVANFRAYDLLYGSLGGILLFLTAVYFASAILLFGGQLASAMPGLGAGAFKSTRDPTQPRTPLIEQARREALGLVRSLIWSRRRSRRQEPPPGSGDREAGGHVS